MGFASGMDGESSGVQTWEVTMEGTSYQMPEGFQYQKNQKIIQSKYLLKCDRAYITAKLFLRGLSSYLC